MVLTDRDVGLIDLSAQSLGDITVQLSSSGAALTPDAVAVTPKGSTSSSNGSLAIRLDDDPDLILVDLTPAAPTAAHSFAASPTVVTVGGVPADIAFVTTNTGLQLAALIPASNTLTLIDPATSVLTDMDVGGPFENMSIVTSELGASGNGDDVALLWSPGSPRIAFVSFDLSGTSQNSSLQTLTLGQSIQAVIDVPPGTSGTDPLKILVGSDGRTFFVLDLVARTASPILSLGNNTTLTPAPTGNRAWLYDQGGSSLGLLYLPSLETKDLLAQRAGRRRI